MAYTPRIAAHRFVGVTHFPVFKGPASLKMKTPAENSSKGLLQALALKSSLETDLVADAEGKLWLVHSAELKKHIFNPPEGKKYLHEMTSEEVAALGLLPEGQDKIMSLDDLLAALNRTRLPKDFLLNLELKDTMSTGLPRGKPSVAERALRQMEGSGILHQTRFSSFSVDLLAEIAALNPKAALGALFDISYNGGDAGQKTFADGEETYLAFTPENIAAVKTRLGESLKALHPEISSLTKETVGLARTHGLEIATWAWRENSPRRNPNSPAPADRAQALAAHAIHLCRDARVPLTIITDYVREMRDFVPTVKPHRFVGLREWRESLKNIGSDHPVHRHYLRTRRPQWWHLPKWMRRGGTPTKSLG